MACVPGPPRSSSSRRNTSSSLIAQSRDDASSVPVSRIEHPVNLRRMESRPLFRGLWLLGARRSGAQGNEGGSKRGLPRDGPDDALPDLLPVGACSNYTTGGFHGRPDTLEAIFVIAHERASIRVSIRCMRR